jgi:hypothetical protein
MTTRVDNDKTCEDVRDELVAVLDGTASAELYDHIADCDDCRDLRHDAAQAERVAARGGDDYQHPADFTAKLLATLDARPSSEPQVSGEKAERAEKADKRGPQTERLPAAKTVRSEEPTAPQTERLVAAETSPAATVTPSSARVEADDTETGPRTEPLREPSAKPAQTVVATAVSDLGEATLGRSPHAEELDEVERAPEAARPAELQKVKKTDEVRRSQRRVGIAGLAGVLALAAGTAAYVMTRGPHDGPIAGGEGSRWAGKVTQIVRASQSAGEGISVCDSAGSNCQKAVEGVDVKAGSILRTDGFSRVSMKMGDGSEMILDRGSELVLGTSAPRSAAIKKGAMVCDIAHLENGANAHIDVPGGSVEVLGTKFAIFAADGDKRSRVEVTRGVVRLTDDNGQNERVFAGEEGRVEAGRRVSVSPSANIAEATEWSERTDGKKAADGGLVRGLGELRAKKPGAKDERDAAVRLAKHDVKVRIVDNVARTEIDETFQNDTDDELEGIFRFPLPPDAQIERLALEVNGKLEEGAFVERDKAAAIWRGVIQHAVPTAPKPVEEIIWVPGPWRDPALLEWKRGGRFELRIFPIPKRGSRRVVLGYTQTVGATGGVRRYTYPLPHDTRGSTIVDDFHVDLQVLGHDKAFGVRPSGYTMTDGASTSEHTERKELRQARFVPAGDLTVEYALPDRDKEVSTWAYQPSTGTDTAPYAVLALRPRLPRVREEGAQTHVIVVDSSRSMVGERFERAKVVATQMIREMDGRDRVQLLACDTSCRALDTRLLDAGGATAEAASRFLGSITPDGATDAVAILQAAKAAGRGETKQLHVVYVGDGGISSGPSKADHLTAEVKRLFPQGEGTVTAVAIGADADVNTLAAVARGGGGVVVPYVPGQTASATAISALSSSYGASLRSPELVLPAGFVAVAPATLDTIRAGSETLVLARMTQPNVDGEALLRGTVGGEKFEQKYPLKVLATSDQGNAFVPRLYAAARIADLERAGGDSAKTAIIDLSKQFAVASRYTSLLVLESQAMFTAFGLDRARQSPAWTGEDSAQGSSADGTEAVAGPGEDERADLGAAADAFGSIGSIGHGAGVAGGALSRDKDEKSKSSESKAEAAPAKKRAAPMDMANPFDADDSRSPAEAAPPRGEPAGGGKADRAMPPPAPMATMPPPAAKAAPPRPPVTTTRRGPARLGDGGWSGRSQRMVPMRKIWERKGRVVNDLAVWHGSEAAKLIAAESSALSRPDSRTAQRDLFAQYALHGRLDRASEVAEKWASRDALDPDALVARADLAARQGDREGAIRILGGLADLRPDDASAQNRLAGLFDRALQPRLACGHRIALAEQRPTDVGAQAAAIPCARSTGFVELADRLLADVPQDKRAAVDTALAKALTITPPVRLRGDVQIEAIWNAPVDLDVALVDKTGTRLSWLGAGKHTVTALGATDPGKESVGFVNLPTGDYVVEVSRARGSEGGAVSGTVTIRAAGGVLSSVPFVLTGGRAEVAHVKITMQSRLVPANDFGGGAWR